MQLFVRDARTMAVDAPEGATVLELKELWSMKAFGVVSTASWVRGRACPASSGRPAPRGRRRAPRRAPAAAAAPAARRARARRTRSRRSPHTRRAILPAPQSLVHAGRPLPDDALLSAAGVRAGDALCARLRLRGGGGDGGSTGAESRSCYLEMYAVSSGAELQHMGGCNIRGGARGKTAGGERGSGAAAARGVHRWEV
jgi:hypothetical protein